jgi:D-arabinitol dehydrogenase (NADP+)
MRAVLYTKPLTYSLDELPDRGLEPGEVRLAVLRVGVCGTDMHLHQGHFGARYPRTPGHEIVGEVIEVTEGSGFSVGDRVAVEDGVYCGTCAACKAGRFLHCTDIRALGVSLPGGAAERLVVSATKCYSIGGLDLDVAVLAEPLACVIHAMDRLAIRAGARVLVLGSGTAGQLLAIMARRNGASEVTVAGSSPFKLGIAKDLGADRIVAVDRTPGAIQTALGGIAPKGFDVVIDATGAVSMLESAIDLASIGGTILVYGVAGAADRLAVSPYEVFKRELTIMGSYAQALNIGRAVSYLENLPEGINRLITHRFGLGEYGRALETLGSPSCIKAVVLPSG